MKSDTVDTLRALEEALLAFPGCAVDLLGDELLHRCVAARSTNWDWDVLFVRRLRAPENPEFVLGALAEGDEPFWDQEAIKRFRVDPEEIDYWDVHADMNAARQRLCGSRHVPNVRGRNVIVIDDGVDSGTGARAAARALRKGGAKEIWGAFPVARPGTNLAEYDKTLFLLEPEDFHFEGAYYRDFDAPSNEELFLSIHHKTPVEQTSR